ncbi:MAG: BrnT family toxin [Syntrophobacterales bacterium]|nr:BrnT family toxin [Syntrophobacterales bacterium]
MKLTFEWDEVKASANFKKHSVFFEAGKTIFNDPFLLTFPGIDNSRPLHNSLIRHSGENRNQ